MPYSEWAPEDRAGAHIMAGFEGNSPPPPLLDRIREGRVGGVVLFTRNIESSGQTLELTHSLQCAAAESPHAGPLLIAIDQEGGRVSRLSEDFTRFPAARVFGRIGDPELVSRCARACAAELRASGINANFAPVLDILTNPDCEVIGDRAYGDDAELVSAMGAAAIQGLQAGGVAAWAKHFPGIGDMAPDPHETLPSSGLSLGALRGGANSSPSARPWTLERAWPASWRLMPSTSKSIPPALRANRRVSWKDCCGTNSATAEWPSRTTSTWAPSMSPPRGRF